MKLFRTLLLRKPFYPRGFSRRVRESVPCSYNFLEWWTFDLSTVPGLTTTLWGPPRLFPFVFVPFFNNFFSKGFAKRPVRIRTFKANPVIRVKRMTFTMGFGEKINGSYRIVITEMKRESYANGDQRAFAFETNSLKINLVKIRLLNTIMCSFLPTNNAR